MTFKENPYGGLPFPQQEPPLQDLAIASFVCGIAGLFVWGASIFGLVLAIIALRSGNTGTMAKAGLALSIVGIVLVLVPLVACVACLGCAGCTVALYGLFEELS